MIQQIKSYIILTVLFIFSCPFVLATFISLLVRFSWSKVITFILALCGGYLWNAVACFLYDKGSLQRLINGFLIRFHRCSYERINTEEIIPVSISDNLRYGPSIFSSSGPSVYLVKRLSKYDAYPSTYSSYPMTMSPTCIFINTPPAKMNAVQKFCFYHELGHSSRHHYAVLRASSVRSLYLQVLFVLTALLTDGSPLLLLVIIMMYLRTLAVANSQSQDDVIGEIIADSFAILHLKDKSEIELVKRVYPHILASREGNESSKRLQQMYFDENSQIASRLTWQDRAYTWENSLAFFQLGAVKFFLKKWISILVATGFVSYIGFNFQPPSLTKILVISFVLLVIPVLIYGSAFRSYAYHKNSVERFIEIRHVDSPNS